MAKSSLQVLHMLIKCVCFSDTNMQKLHSKRSKSAHPPIRRRSRTGSLGDVLLPTRTPLRSPQPSPRRPPGKTGRSMSICTPCIPRPVHSTSQTARNSRKNSVSSIGDHFSSLLSISSQVTGMTRGWIVQLVFSKVALNIGEKVAPKRNSLTPNDLTDILLGKIKKSLKER